MIGVTELISFLHDLLSYKEIDRTRQINWERKKDGVIEKYIETDWFSISKFSWLTLNRDIEWETDRIELKGK